MGQPHGRLGGNPPAYTLDEKTRQEIIVMGDPEKTVKEAEKFGGFLNQVGLKSSQIRNIFGTVRQIQMDWPLWATPQEQQQALRQLQLLKPKLAYQAKRNAPVQPLAKILTKAIDDIHNANDVANDRQRFQHFVDFFEAILAYYVAAGGK